MALEEHPLIAKTKRLGYDKDSMASSSCCSASVANAPGIDFDSSSKNLSWLWAPRHKMALEEHPLIAKTKRLGYDSI
jgi:hypothetical protein